MAYIKQFQVALEWSRKIFNRKLFSSYVFFKWQGKNLSWNVQVFTQTPIQNGSLAKFNIWLTFWPGIF